MDAAPRAANAQLWKQWLLLRALGGQWTVVGGRMGAVLEEGLLRPCHNMYLGIPVYYIDRYPARVVCLISFIAT